jgi:hypothetical protein
MAPEETTTTSVPDFTIELAWRAMLFNAPGSAFLLLLSA